MFESNYFAIEREGNFVDHIVPEKNFPDYDLINMTFDEAIEFDLSGFVCSIMDFANMYFDEQDRDTTVTLINGEDDSFIWSVMIGINDSNEDEFVYKLVDWRREDGSKFRYADE